MKIIELEFTKDFMIENKGCYSLDQLNECSFMKQEPITLESILNSEISVKDKYWFCCKKVFSKEQNQRIVISLAESVLFIYEAKYPDDDRPRQAIQVAKDYLNGTIGIDELRKKRNAAAYAAFYADNAAAYAAANAAYAANAADSAAYAAFYASNADYPANTFYAAYAADYTAYASANAADAAAYAANAAAYDKNNLNQILLDNLINFCKENEKI